MDHRQIDETSVAERYLNHALRPEDRSAFEAHLVDCPECTDRLMLAGMFHARNGVAPPLRARFVAQFKPWQLTLMFVAAAILLLALPTAYFLWQLHQT